MIDFKRQNLRFQSDFILSEMKENPDMIGDRNTDTAIDKTSE